MVRAQQLRHITQMQKHTMSASCSRAQHSQLLMSWDKDPIASHSAIANDTSGPNATTTSTTSSHDTHARAIALTFSSSSNSNSSSSSNSSSHYPTLVTHRRCQRRGAPPCVHAPQSARRRGTTAGGGRPALWTSRAPAAAMVAVAVAVAVAAVVVVVVEPLC